MAITNPAVAVAVINEAKARAVYSGEMPETDGAKLAQANELLTMAEQAKQAGVQAEAVHAVIAAAQQEEGASSVAPNPFNPPAAAPAPTPAPTPAPAPVAAPEPTPAPAVPEGVTIDDAIPGYDDLKVGDILAAMEKLNDAGIAFVKAYEAQEGERAKIMNFERHPMVDTPATAETPAPVAAPAPPEAPAPTQGGVAFANAQPTEYATVEPWEGYKSAKIKDIMAIVENVFTTNGEAAKPLLAHVWEYEKNNKERDSLIKKLTTLAQNGVQTSPPTVPTPEPAPAPAEPAGVVSDPPFAQTQPEAPAPAPAPTQNVFAPTPAVSVPVVPQGGVAPLEGATQRALSAVENEGLPVPSSVQSPPDLPEDFTVLGDVEVRKYQSQFNACQARAHYLLAVAEGHSNDAKIAADAATRAYIQATEFPAKTTVTQMEAAANADPKVSEARAVQHEYAELARQYKALRDIYQATCERLSREQTGRQSEHATVR
jgi:hypothetical protein